MTGSSVSKDIFLACVVLTGACLCVGCGSQYPAVSGKVTYDGKPVSGVQLVFNPIGESVDSGPISLSVTDEQGVFSLETRDGKSGAVAGQHKVGFDWSDIRAYTMRELERSLSEAKGIPEKEAEIKARIAEVKQKLASRPKLKAGLQTMFTVPEGGTDAANFELTDF